MKTNELDGRSIENPAFCDHKRGRNWAAIVRGKNAANSNRDFLRTHGKIVDLEPVAPGDVLEFGGDYITSCGNRRPDRRWFLVQDINDDVITYEQHSTLAKALRAARTVSTEAEGAVE